MTLSNVYLLYLPDVTMFDWGRKDLYKLGCLFHIEFSRRFISDESVMLCKAPNRFSSTFSEPIVVHVYY
jgi:hypothetical protein